MHRLLRFYGRTGWSLYKIWYGRKAKEAQILLKRNVTVEHRTEKRLKAENSVVPDKKIVTRFSPSHSPLKGILKKKNRNFEISL